MSTGACDLGDGPTPFDPCSSDFACEVEGVDVALLGVVPRWTADQPYDDEVDAHVVEAGDTLTVDVLLVNRGTEAGTDSIFVYGYFRDFEYFVSAGGMVRPLEIGEHGIAQLRFQIPTGERWVIESGDALLARGFFAIDGDFTEEDVDPSNHVGPPVDYHPRVPILDVAPVELGDTLRSHEPYETVLAVTNRSPFVDFAGGVDLVFCMSHLGHGYCEQGLLETHSPVTIPAIPAWATMPVAAQIEFDAESLWYFDTQNFVFVNPCLPPDADRPLCLHSAETEHDYVVALNDLVRECVTSPLVPPDTLRAMESLCLVNHGAAEGTAYTIGVFQGSAGQCVRVKPLADQWSATVVDLNLMFVLHDVISDCYRPPHDGTYYLIAHAPATANPAGGVIAIELD